MRMAESFARCPSCSQGWVEQRTVVLLNKDSIVGQKPLVEKSRVEYRCTSCNTLIHHYEVQEDN